MLSAIVMISFVNATWTGVLALVGGVLSVVASGDAARFKANPLEGTNQTLRRAPPIYPHSPRPAPAAPPRVPVA
jgi:hypothetical protein